MRRKNIEKLKAHAANHPELIQVPPTETTLNGVQYTRDEAGWWWMHPAPGSTWPTTPMRVTDPAQKRRIEAALAEASDEPEYTEDWDRNAF